MLSSALNISSNWRLIYQEYKQAQEVVEKGYKPLPSFEIPILFDRKILIAKTVSTIPLGKRWKWAGNLRAFQAFPNGGVNAQKSEIAIFSLYLNRSKLILLPNVASNFELVLSDAFWLRDLQLTIYEFIGDAD
ncbi:hypothetical protein [Fortiea contorta]|uniref:hypothetical protein n=1 Tax=Fortiea contorta TaxID=1892405 RepID=UPI00037A1CD2|nr:hypothetical protein [Fortiea contorta]